MWRGMGSAGFAAEPTLATHAKWPRLVRGAARYGGGVSIEPSRAGDLAFPPPARYTAVLLVRDSGSQFDSVPLGTGFPNAACWCPFVLPPEASTDGDVASSRQPPVVAHCILSQCYHARTIPYGLRMML